MPVPDGFTERDDGRLRILVRRGLESEIDRLGARVPPEGVERWVGGGRAPHALVRLRDGTLAVVRAFHRGGAVRHLVAATYLRGDRAAAELAALERARAGGVRVPEPLAAVRERLRVGYRARIALRWIDGCEDAAVVLSGDPAAGPRVWRAIGAELARLHGVGIAHPDLNLRNVLVPSDGGRVWLLDLDRARSFRGAVPAPRAARDVVRLLRSARKLGVPADVRAFESGYASTGGSGAAAASGTVPPRG